MTQDTKTETYEEQQRRLTEEALSKPKYFSFDKDIKVKVQLFDWGLAHKNVPDYNDKTKLVEKLEFKCNLMFEDETYEFSTLSARFMEKVLPLLDGLDGRKDNISLTIKKLGEGNGVQYDVEKVE